MGVAISISVGITLLALTGAMFLLAKTNKDGLGTMFKAVAWIIIVSCFINLGCTALYGLIKFSGRHARHEMKMHKKMEKEHKKWLKGNRKYHAYGEFHESMQAPCCGKNMQHGAMNCHQQDGSGHCESKCMSPKDSVIHKTKTR